MSRQSKTVRRFLAKPSDFRLTELSRLLKGFGYAEMKTGKTAGSCIAYVNKISGHIIRLHKPHAGQTLKRYQMDIIEEALKAKGLLE